MRQRLTIDENSDHTLQAADVLVEVYPGPDGPVYVVDRDMPDMPDYWAGLMGTATVTNAYGVSYPGQHGIWVSKPEGLWFVLIKARKNMRNMWAEDTVSDFERDLDAGDLLHQASQKLAEQKTRTRLWKRRFEKVDEAQRAVMQDINALMRTDGHASVGTSIGATLKTWLNKK
jgi:hypothetical protein